MRKTSEIVKSILYTVEYGRRITARKEEVEHAQEEGIIFDLLYNPVKVLGDENGWVNGIECVRMELGEQMKADVEPVEIKDSDFTIDIDCMIIIIGTSPNPLIRHTTEGLEVNRKGCFIVDDKNMTSRAGIYAGGDAVTGAATVIQAMGAGKKAASSIHEYLSK